MNASFRTRATRMLRCVPIVALLAVAAHATVRAQFQSVFGGLGHEAAKGGVIQTRDGNFTAVGYATSFTADQDVYVVKTNGCGFVVWARLYDLGGIDEGVKIREFPDGSLIIVGSTENARNCCTRNDAFLLKLDANGAVQWAKTYGGLDDDQGLDVIIPTADDARATITVAGRSNSFGSGDYDGWLFRTNGAGTLLWGRVYGAWGVDAFNSLDFACDGNIIAAGYTRSFSRAGDEDILVVWASPADGAFQRANVYGSFGDEAARCVVTSGHSFYLAGYTTSSGSVTEGYVMRAICNTGDVLADRAYGGSDGTGDDQFTELRVLPTGNVVLTGFIDDAPGGLGGYDMWLTELDPNLGFVQTKVYGGRGIDQGWSVAVADVASREYRIIQAGLTYSFGFGRVDLYEVLANRAFDGFCNQGDPQLQRAAPAFIANEVRLADPRVRAACDVRVGVTRNRQWETLCTPCDIPADDVDDEGLSVNTPEVVSAPIALNPAPVPASSGR